RHQARVGDVVIRLSRSAQVPLPQTPKKKRQGMSRNTAKPFTGDVIFVPPNPAHRRVTVTNVNCVPPPAHSLGIARTAAEDQIVLREIEVLDRKRIKHEVVTKTPVNVR